MIGRTTRRTMTALALLAATLTVAAACASRPATPGDSAPEDAAPLLTTPMGATVLDAGEGAQLCLGAVAMSYPPQCGGAEIAGWDWSEHAGQFEEAAGVRWGMFTLTGHYDGDAYTFTPTKVVAWDEDSASNVTDEDPVNPFATPCPLPEDGWAVIDPTKADDMAQQAAFTAAAELPGYAASWIDQQSSPHIVNVSVVGDTAAAEKALRAVWGGPLCVSTATHTDAELQEIVAELSSEADGRHILGVGADGMAGTVIVSVVYDDGTLQQRYNDEFGEGLVRVESSLTPAS